MLHRPEVLRAGWLRSAVTATQGEDDFGGEPLESEPVVDGEEEGADAVF
jgi:hypothetical protein